MSLRMILVLLVCNAGLWYGAYRYHAREHGGLSHGQPIDLSLIRCDDGEPYYGSVTTNTIFSTMIQSVDVSWQCRENDGARKYIKLEPYHLSMDGDEP